MAAIAYPTWVVIDDAGAIVLGATVSIASVKTKAGVDVAAHGATVSVSEANVCVDYDAEAKGEAWVTLAVSKAGSTFTGLNAAPRAYLTADAQKVAPLAFVAATGEVKADPHRAGAPIAANTTTEAKVDAIKAKTDALTAVPADGGTVSLTPTPTLTTFSGTGAALRASAGGYARPSSPMRVYFTSGPNAGQERTLTPSTGHARAGAVHAFTLSAPLQFLPANPDTFVLLPGDGP